MEKPIEIFQQITIAADPSREVNTLTSEDLAALIQELRKKRWSKNYAAGYMLDECLEVAVGRFIAEVEINF